METSEVGRQLFFIILLIFGIGFGILYYIGHRRKWSLFYDHETKEWVFARKNSIAYQMLGDPDKWIYPTILAGIAFFCIVLIILIGRLVFYVYK
jgi:hypothetical protein